MTEEDKKFDLFTERITQTPLPLDTTPMARIQMFAREMAEGALHEFWDFFIEFGRTGSIKFNRLQHDKSRFESHYFNIYLYRRWNNKYPRLELVALNGYINLTDAGFEINKSSFDLRKEVEPANVFISYKRSESSAFALLIAARLQNEGLEPFLDMALIPGEKWHAGLETRIEKYDYLIAVIGKNTLTSEICLNEIRWALEYGKRVIPVFHNRFTYVSKKWSLEPKIDIALTELQQVIVKEESASGYNAAIDELLNKAFGIMP